MPQPEEAARSGLCFFNEKEKWEGRKIEMHRDIETQGVGERERDTQIKREKERQKERGWKEKRKRGRKRE